MVESPAGYAHPQYAASLAEFGAPLLLPGSGGWVLERGIPGFADKDAMGCYPLFCCRDWSQLSADLESDGRGWVTLSVVADPFGDFELDHLKRCFPDVLIPFKEHSVVDLHLPLDRIGSRKNRQTARRALRDLKIEVSPDPSRQVDQWWALYRCLIEKHGLKGIHAFSKEAFARQLAVPGTVLLWAMHGDAAVGVTSYVVQGDVVYCHLAACDSLGYRLDAFRAMDWFSFEYFRSRARWLDLGGGAGIHENGHDGLHLYKSRWATTTRTAYFCGRVLNRKRYDEIVRTMGIAPSGYFPAYRRGEFE